MSTPFLRGPANESSATFSPDGRWVAYVSDESGAAEVYVQPLLGPGRTQVSVDGGSAPQHGHATGASCFSRRATRCSAQPSRRGETFSSGAVRRLFSGPYTFDAVTVNYDVSPDREHFLVLGNQVAAPDRLELVLNWFAEPQSAAPK